MGIPIATYSLNPMIFLTNHPLKRRCVLNNWKLKICVRIRLVDAGTDEIVCAVITNLKNGIRHHVGDSHKIATVEFRR